MINRNSKITLILLIQLLVLSLYIGLIQIISLQTMKDLGQKTLYITHFRTKDIILQKNRAGIQFYHSHKQISQSHFAF